MKLFLVLDRSSWGYSHNAVRAESAEQARKLAKAPENNPHVEVIELEPAGEPQILWTYDHSPDTAE